MVEMNAGRRQLPPGMLELVLPAVRTRESRFNVAICDQLGPSFRSNQNVLTGTTIPKELANLFFHFSSARRSEGGREPIATMAPDKQDRESCPPQVIRYQWRHVAQGSNAWKGIRFTPIDRNDFYQMLPAMDVVVRTTSREPYANVIVTIDPSSAHVLRRLPTELPPKLLEILSQAGHSHAVAIVPRRAFRRADINEGAAVFQVEETTLQMAKAISTVWLPDCHEQKRDGAAKKPLAIYPGKGELDPYQLSDTLTGIWRERRRCQGINFSGFRRELKDFRTLVVIVAQDDGTGASYLMKNGISGANGGF